MRIHGLIGGVLLLCLAVGTAEAQAPSSERLMDFGGGYATKVQNSDSSIGTEIQRSLGWAKIKVPISLRDGNALLLGVSYEGHFISYSSFNSRTVGGITFTQGDLPTPLHSLGATVGFLWKFAEEWSALAQFTPGIHSDFEDITSRDFIWAGNLLFIHPFGHENRAGDRNRIGFGAAYSDNFGDPIPFPLLLLDWYPSEDWFVKGTLPVDLDVGYRFSRPLSVGLGGQLKGYRYRLTDAAPWFGAVIRYREFQIGPFVDFGLTEKIRLRVSGGAAVGQHFEFRDESNDNTLLEGDFKSGGFFNGSLYLAL